MSVLWTLVRAGLRRSRNQLLGIAVVLALGLGVAIASLEAAARTERAYPSYLQRSRVGEIVVNPSFDTDRTEQIVASTPGVSSYVSDALLTASPDRGDPSTKAESDATQVRVSTDGRYTKQDRPVVHQGRMIRSGAEAFVNVEMARALGLHVGDTLPLAFATPDYSLPDGTRGGNEPLGRVETRVVGIGVFAEEVLVDGLYPRHRVLITPDVGARFDCRPPQPDPDDPRSADQIVKSLLPPGCSKSYRYFSLRVDGGDRGVGSVTAALAARFAEENDRLPAALRAAANVGYDPIPTITADERQRVQRSLEPVVRALQLFAVAAGACTLVVVLLGAVPIARRHERDVGIWRALGTTRAVRTAGIGLPLSAAVAAGLAGSVVLGWLASGLGPVASARSVGSAGRLGLSAAVVVVVLGVAVPILALGVLAAANVAAKWRLHPAPRVTSRSSRRVAGTNNLSLKLGVRAAVGGAGDRALLTASVAAVSAVVATVVFSVSVGRLVSDPERFGWPYDVAATVNFGYGGTTDQAAIAATLDRPEVRHWGLATLSGLLTINDQPMPYVAEGSGFEAMRLPLVAGERPVADDEIALGALSAKRLGLGVGDTVLVKTSFGDREATVRGLVVLPPIGPFQSDRASLGTGALVSARFFEAVLIRAAGEAGLEPAQMAAVTAGFVAVDLRPDVDRRQFVAAISDRLHGWDASGIAPVVYPEPVRPATVADVAAMRSVPVALAGLLALTMGVALMLAIAAATRARRHELAVLRALGCIGSQLRATVRWQALTVVGVGLGVGIPLGLAFGRIAYKGFAAGLGVPPDPVFPLLWVALLVVVTIGVALLAAVGPGHRAARVSAGDTLRDE